jgi:hypothetical protein
LQDLNIKVSEHYFCTLEFYFCTHPILFLHPH